MKKVYVFANVQDVAGQWFSGVAICEDGHVLAGHVSSSMALCKTDMGVYEDRDWSGKRTVYAEHCPDGFEVEFIETPDEIRSHPGLKEAFRLNKLLAEAAGAKENSHA